MADQVCSRCGTELPAAAIFCNQCGSRELIRPDAPTIPLVTTEVPPPTEISTPPTEISPPPTVAYPAGPPFAPPPNPGDSAGPWVPPTALPVPPDPAEIPTSRTGGRLGAILVLIGGAVALVGSFGEWMKMKPDWADAVTLNGWTLSNDAKVIAVLAGVAIVAAVVVIAGNLRGPIRVLSVIIGIVIVGLAAYDTYDILQRLPDSLENSGVQGVEIAAPGIGLILVLAGGVVIILGALVMRGGRQPVTAPANAGGPGERASSMPPTGYLPSAPPTY